MSEFVEQNNGVDTEHQYFVLESEQGQQGTNNNGKNNDNQPNSYFDLEKVSQWNDIMPMYIELQERFQED